MTGLEQTFYIMAIVYMAIMFVAIIAGVVAIFAIKAKINQIERKIEDKLRVVSTVAHFGEEIFGKAKKVFHGGK